MSTPLGTCHFTSEQVPVRQLFTESVLYLNTLDRGLDFENFRGVNKDRQCDTPVQSG